jgi:hypothetical protein
MDAKYGKKEESMTGLADTLRTEATKTVVAEMTKILDKSLNEKIVARDNAQAALDKANSEYKSALEARDVFRKTFGDILAAAPAKQYSYWYRESRTGGRGHFMSRETGTDNTTCSCEASQYGRKCWAQQELIAPSNWARKISKENYDARKLGYVTPVRTW